MWSSKKGFFGGSIQGSRFRSQQDNIFGRFDEGRTRLKIYESELSGRDLSYIGKARNYNIYRLSTGTFSISRQSLSLKSSGRTLSKQFGISAQRNKPSLLSGTRAIQLQIPKQNVKQEQIPRTKQTQKQITIIPRFNDFNRGRGRTTPIIPKMTVSKPKSFKLQFDSIDYFPKKKRYKTQRFFRPFKYTSSLQQSTQFALAGRKQIKLSGLEVRR